MVNKHYNIKHQSTIQINQNFNGNSSQLVNGGNNDTNNMSKEIALPPQKHNIGVTKHYSPPVIRNSSRILNSPNPYDDSSTINSITTILPSSSTSIFIKDFKHCNNTNNNNNRNNNQHHQRTSSQGNSNKDNNNSFNINYNCNNNGGNNNGNYSGTNSNNIENTYEKLIIDDKYGSIGAGNNNNNSNFGRNIALSYDTVSLASETYHKIGGQRQFDIKDITDINDIGRFQYIVQMDKEMDTTTIYNQPMSNSSGSTSSSSSGDRSSVSNRSLSFKSFQRDKIHFWKTDTTKYHLTTSTTSSFRDRTNRLLNSLQKNGMKEHLATCWDYSRWPIFLLLSCLVLGSLIYVLYLGSYRHSSESNDERYVIGSSSNFIDHNNLDYSDGNSDNIENADKDDLLKYIITTNSEIFNTADIREIEPTTTPITLSDIEFDVLRELQEDEESSERKINKKDENQQYLPSSTAKTPMRNTKILKFTTKQGFKFDDDDGDLVESLDIQSSNQNQQKTILSPVAMTDSSVQTSGHQNNFGISFEEDERILKLYNEDLMRDGNQDNSTTAKPQLNPILKVSPTLPAIIHHKDTSPGIKSTTESIFNTQNTDDINVCQSTSLEMCQGVLQYDLTTNKSKQLVATMDMAHFKYLIASNCSLRAAEFICSYLEPECRPLGPLEPCKRICKSILEPCSGIIASSEILTMMFDCDRYPDSNDRNICEDPTRRSAGDGGVSKCHDNEFQCLDSTCIPKQWKCDNIKDCSLGEEEENCKFCHHEEFRCQSDSNCISGNLQCDGYEDCSDGSDENDCLDYDHTNTDVDGKNDGSNYEDELNDDYPMPRIYSFASIQSPDNPDSLPFFAIPLDDEDESKDGIKIIEENSSRGGAEGLFDHQDNRSLDLDGNDDSDEKNETKSNKNGRSSEISKSLANFQDSTEIMMTSDSEYDFKYSKYRTNRTRSNTKRITGSSSINNLKRSPVTTTTTEKSSKTRTTFKQNSTPKPVTTTEKTASTSTTTTTSKKNIILMPEILSEPIQYCPEAQLRCITGECITVDQLCDKKIDCPDGADEARCIYKDMV